MFSTFIKLISLNLVQIFQHKYFRSTKQTSVNPVPQTNALAAWSPFHNTQMSSQNSAEHLEKLLLKTCNTNNIPRLHKHLEYAKFTIKLQKKASEIFEMSEISEMQQKPAKTEWKAAKKINP